MKINFIGTGSGLASLKRFHSSMLLITENYKLLIDSGDGIARALLSQNISFNELDGLLISHLHPDHFSGLGSLLTQMKLRKRIKEFDIFAHQNIVEFIKKYVMQSYIFMERMGFDVNYKAYNDEENINVGGQLSFISRQNSHLNKYARYKTAGNIKFSCSSFLFIENNTKIFYTGDIGKADDVYIFNDYSIEALITEISHVSLTDIISAYRELNAGRIIITHINDEEIRDLEEIRDHLRKEELENIVFAADGDILEF